MLQSGRAAPAKFHTELALIYLRMATAAGHARREGDLHTSTSGSHLQPAHSGLGKCPATTPFRWAVMGDIELGETYCVDENEHALGYLHSQVTVACGICND